MPPVTRLAWRRRGATIAWTASAPNAAWRAAIRPGWPPCPARTPKASRATKAGLFQIESPVRPRGRGDPALGQILGHRVLGRRVLDRQVLDRQVLDRQALDRQVLDRQVLDRQVLDRQVLGSRFRGSERSLVRRKAILA